MTGECDRVAACGFLKKHGSADGASIKGMIAAYCRGSKMDDCKRKEYADKHDAPPSEDMLPNGEMLAG